MLHSKLSVRVFKKHLSAKCIWEYNSSFQNMYRNYKAKFQTFNSGDYELSVLCEEFKNKQLALKDLVGIKLVCYLLIGCNYCFKSIRLVFNIWC